MSDSLKFLFGLIILFAISAWLEGCGPLQGIGQSLGILAIVGLIAVILLKKL